MTGARRIGSPVAVWLVIALAVAQAIASSPPALAQRTMLVHLPSAPVEAANRQAGAITQLAELLSQGLAGEPIEAKIYRRVRDANRFLNDGAEQVVLVLCDASFIDQLPAGFVPGYRFVRGGGETYRRLLVVQNDRQELRKLVDLEGKTLTIVETAGPGDAGFLARAVFEGEIDPAAWFASLEPAVDDFSATADVLYGKTDAALVAEFNPLLKEHLGKGLRMVFESPGLSLPVLALRESAFGRDQLTTLERLLSDLARDPLGQKVATTLGIDGLRALPRGTSLAASEARATKVLEIAAPSGREWRPTAPALPPVEALSFAVAVELPEIPLPPGDESGQ